MTSSSRERTGRTPLQSPLNKKEQRERKKREERKSKTNPKNSPLILELQNLVSFHLGLGSYLVILWAVKPQGEKRVGVAEIRINEQVSRLLFNILILLSFLLISLSQFGRQSLSYLTQRQTIVSMFFLKPFI